MSKNKEDGYARCNLLGLSRCNGQSASKFQYLLTFVKYSVKVFIKTMPSVFIKKEYKMATKINSGKNHPRFKDLTGLRFGQLVCKDYVRHPSYTEKEQRWVWKCVCDCGETCFVRTAKLTKEKPQQSCKKCSDLKAASRKVLDDFLSLRNRLYSRYKKGAIERGYSFEITFEDMETIIYKNCFYCNQEPQNHPSDDRYKNGKGIFKRNGIDRRDNTIGYTLENCVPCCSQCNTMKMDTSLPDFLLKIQQIYFYSIEKGSTTIESIGV